MRNISKWRTGICRALRRSDDLQSYVEVVWSSSNESMQASVSDLDPPEALAIQLRADKNLDPATANALAALVKAAYRDLPKRSDAEQG